MSAKSKQPQEKSNGPLVWILASGFPIVLLIMNMDDIALPYGTFKNYHKIVNEKFLLSYLLIAIPATVVVICLAIIANKMRIISIRSKWPILAFVLLILLKLLFILYGVEDKLIDFEERFPHYLLADPN